MPVKERLRAVRATVTRAAAERAFAGTNYWCPCCDATFRRFHDLNGANRRCWTCGSLERHRAVALLVRQARPEMLTAGMRLLHVAPEVATAQVFRAVPDVDYVGGDLLGEFEGVRLDVTDLEFPDDHFDGVICSHVLEHVPDDRAAMRELRRVLKPGGWGILPVPNPRKQQVTDEDPSVTDPEERRLRFGQADHVRKYGWDYLDRLREAGFDAVLEDQEELFGRGYVYRARLRRNDELEPLITVS